jgi:hypothetical protein
MTEATSHSSCIATLIIPASCRDHVRLLGEDPGGCPTAIERGWRMDARIWHRWSMGSVRNPARLTDR